MCQRMNAFASVPEKEGWDRVMNLNVKGIFYCESRDFAALSKYSLGLFAVTAALTPLLEKDSTNVDPAAVINISSVASLVAVTESSTLAEPGHGLWSCAFGIAFRSGLLAYVV